MFTSHRESGGTTTLATPLKSQPSQITLPDQTVIDYTYDALGVRKTKSVDNVVTTKYLTASIFGYSHVLAELNANGDITATYAYAGNEILKAEPIAGDRTQDQYLLHGGSGGSISHAIDPNGTVVNEYSYDAFGHRTTVSGNDSTRYGYTGEEYDADTGLLYLRARYYDPLLGRFISVDPFLGRLEEPVTQNRYVYVQNNPLSFVDPSGLWSADAHDLLIQYAFAGMLPQADIEAIKQSSRAFDSATQDSIQSHLHSMAAPGDSVSDAISKRDTYIEMSIIGVGMVDNRDQQLMLFGQLAHPIMDSSSPVHVDVNDNPIAWNLANLLNWSNAVQHGITDWSPFSKESRDDLTPEILEAAKTQLRKSYCDAFK